MEGSIVRSYRSTSEDLNHESGVLSMHSTGSHPYMVLITSWTFSHLAGQGRQRVEGSTHKSFTRLTQHYESPM